MNNVTESAVFEPDVTTGNTVMNTYTYMKRYVTGDVIHMSAISACSDCHVWLTVFIIDRLMYCPSAASAVYETGGLFSNLVVDVGASWDETTNVFKAPIDGIYLINLSYR